MTREVEDDEENRSGEGREERFSLKHFAHFASICIFFLFPVSIFRPKVKLGDLLKRLKETYCGTIGVE